MGDLRWVQMEKGIPEKDGRGMGEDRSEDQNHNTKVFWDEWSQVNSGKRTPEKNGRGKSEDQSEDRNHNTKVEVLMWTMKLSALSVFCSESTRWLTAQRDRPFQRRTFLFDWFTTVTPHLYQHKILLWNHCFSRGFTIANHLPLVFLKKWSNKWANEQIDEQARGIINQWSFGNQFSFCSLNFIISSLWHMEYY